MSNQLESWLDKSNLEIILITCFAYHRVGLKLGIVSCFSKSTFSCFMLLVTCFIHIKRYRPRVGIEPQPPAPSAQCSIHSATGHCCKSHQFLCPIGRVFHVSCFTNHEVSGRSCFMFHVPCFIDKKRNPPWGGIEPQLPASSSWCSIHSAIGHCCKSYQFLCPIG